jgi:putative heme-binding domain-containing protein
MTNWQGMALAAATTCTLLVGLAPLLAERARHRAEGASASLSVRQAGDASRGRTLVESSGCFDCHRIGDRGLRLGPDLSDIGGRRTPERLQQALVAPDEEVLPENRFVRLVTREGATVTGKLLNQDAFSVQLINPKEELKTYPKAGLREYTVVDKGLMPSVQGKLTEQQVADVVAYLGSLKGS